MGWKANGLLGLMTAMSVHPLFAETQAMIMAANTRAIVYLEVDDPAGKPSVRSEAASPVSTLPGNRAIAISRVSPSV
jgi:hypothetical protein